jgi:putative ABC transport system permease protein
VNLKLLPGSDAKAIVEGLKARFSDDRLFFSTAEERHRDLEKSLTGIDAFFRLVGFVALFLGAIGVASVVHVYVRQKITTVAILRCLGAGTRQTFSIYLLQGLAIGLFGAVIGALVGIAAQWALPLMLKDLIPFKIHFFISWPAIASGMVSGLVICLLFTLLPLLAVRRVPPLAAFRSALAEQAGLAFDPWRVVIGVLIPLAVVGFAMWQTNDTKVGVGYAAALAVGFGLLAGTAKLVSMAAKAWSPRQLPYVVRQGIANLHRPNNRTVLLLLSLGLGTFLLIALYLVRTEMLIQIKGPEGASHPNLIFGHVDEDQMDAVAKLAAAEGAPIVTKTPWISMTLLKVNGRPPGRIWRDRFGQRQRDGKWLIVLEATYRDHLLANETITEGKFVPRVQPGATVVPIAIPAWMTRQRSALAHIGDLLDFDVQGVPIHTRVAAVRLTTSPIFTRNFEALFPEGAIDGAPKYYEAGAHAPTPAIASKIQQAVYAAYPEIRVTDLVVLVEAVEHIFNKIAFVIGFMASFIVATGVVMLASAIMTGRFQRIRETVLLRTLGASHRQLVLIQLVEYAILGVLASLVGALLAVGGNLLLAHFVFKITPATPTLLLLEAMGAVTAVTLITGWIANRGVTDYPPLAVLRQET